MITMFVTLNTHLLSTPLRYTSLTNWKCSVWVCCQSKTKLSNSSLTVKALQWRDIWLWYIWGHFLYTCFVSFTPVNWIDDGLSAHTAAWADLKPIKYIICDSAAVYLFLFRLFFKKTWSFYSQFSKLFRPVQERWHFHFIPLWVTDS